MAILFKYWLAFMTALAAALFARDLAAYPANLIPFGLLVFWALFLFTAAEVKAHEKTLEYRRFWAWKQISYDQIGQCAASWIPGLGYVRLGRFVPPWGKLYFVTARPAFGGSPRELMEFINERRARGPIPH
jgi:hypothetical protein